MPGQALGNSVSLTRIAGDGKEWVEEEEFPYFQPSVLSWSLLQPQQGVLELGEVPTWSLHSSVPESALPRADCAASVVPLGVSRFQGPLSVHGSAGVRREREPLVVSR